MRKEAGEGSAHLYGQKNKSLNNIVKNTYKKVKTMNTNFGKNMDHTMEEAGLADMTNIQ